MSDRHSAAKAGRPPINGSQLSPLRAGVMLHQSIWVEIRSACFILLTPEYVRVD